VPKEGTNGEKLQFENLARDSAWKSVAELRRTIGDLNNDGRWTCISLTLRLARPRQKLLVHFQNRRRPQRHHHDAKNWPAMEGAACRLPTKHVWLNDGSGKICRRSAAVGVTTPTDAAPWH